jgi:signal transduction histidine kinase
MIDAVALDDQHRERLTSLGLCAVLEVPIIANDIVFGAFQMLRFDPEPPFSPKEIDLARDVAERAGAVFEQARLLERAQTAIASRDRFLSIAAHELRTPVTSLKGYAQLLSRNVQRRTLSAERLTLSLRAIESSVSRLSTLTDDLIGMSQRELRELPLRKSTIHVPTFLQSIVDRSRTLLDHPVHLDSAVADVQILGDVALLEQVVINLIENAARYSPMCTPVELAAVAHTADVTISVRDQGIGLSGTEQEHMFEPFGRGSEGHSADLAGLGLGLFISKGNVERHGGRIWAESGGRNQGTTVRFALPLHPTPEI